MLLVFGLWFPIIKGLLLTVLAVTQFYVFRYIYPGYRISKDRRLLMFAYSFLAFIIGSILGACFNLFAFTRMRWGNFVEGSALMVSGDLFLSLLQILGFAILLTLPRSRGERMNVVSPMIFIISINVLHPYVNIILAVLVTAFAYNVVRGMRSSKTPGISTILIGLIVLAISKLIVLIPITNLSTQIIAIFAEVIAFSTFILFKEVASLALDDQEV